MFSTLTIFLIKEKYLKTNMRKTLISLLLVVTGSIAMAQDSTKGFKKENLFTGGSVSASFGSGFFGFGVNPLFGYSATKWLDAGIGVNYFYNSVKYEPNDKLRQSTYGAGPFVRLFPVPFLFAQAQLEVNNLSYKYIYGNGTPSEKATYWAGCMLVGAGIATGRVDRGQTFGYFSVLIDVFNDPNSPYINYSGTDKSRVPVIRGGIHIPLFQGNNRPDR
jgi:hypothetical protein